MVRFQLAGSWCWSALAIAVDSTGGVDIVTLTVSQNLEGSPNAVRCSCHPSVSDLSSMSSQFRQGQCMALTKTNTTMTEYLMQAMVSVDIDLQWMVTGS